MTTSFRLLFLPPHLTHNIEGTVRAGEMRTLQLDTISTPVSLDAKHMLLPTQHKTPYMLHTILHPLCDYLHLEKDLSRHFFSIFGMALHC